MSGEMQSSAVYQQVFYEIATAYGARPHQAQRIADEMLLEYHDKVVSTYTVAEIAEKIRERVL